LAKDAESTADKPVQATKVKYTVVLAIIGDMNMLEKLKP
jgi:hypothetical protein